MALWYALCDALPLEMLHWNFMKNALLAILLMAPLFGLTSTMIVTGKMSFFSDALGHSAFTGIAIGALCGIAAPTWVAVIFSLVFALLFSFMRSRSNQTADTLIGVLSSTAVAIGIFVATIGGGSFTKYNKYLIGDILSVTPAEIGMLGIVLLIWHLCSIESFGLAYTAPLSEGYFLKSLGAVLRFPLYLTKRRDGDLAGRDRWNQK